MKGIQDILSERNEDDINRGILLCSKFFTKQERVAYYRAFMRCNQDMFTRLRGRLMRNGVITDENNGKLFYTNAAHNEKDREQTLNAFESDLDFRHTRKER